MHTHAFRTVALLVAAAASGCPSQMHPLEITGIHAPDPLTCLGDFAIVAGAGLVAKDVAGASFVASMSIENTLVTNANLTNFRGNTLDITIERIEATYLPIPATGAAPTPATASIDVYGFVATSGNLQLSNVPVIPPAVIASASALDGLVAKVRLVGRLSDGTTVRSHEVSYPVYFCTNCMTIPACFVPNDPADPDDPNSSTDDPLSEADDADGPNETEILCPSVATGMPAFLSCPL